MQTIRFVLFAAAILLLSAGCGRKEEPAKGDETGRAAASSPSAERQGAPSGEAERSREPFSIDPDKEERIRTGTPAERLASKYELLVERIQIERAESVFNLDRAVDLGLVPLAKEHNRLFEEGTIDTVLALEFARLAEFILAQHLYTERDRSAEQVTKRIARLREMIPEHEKKR